MHYSDHCPGRGVCSTDCPQNQTQGRYSDGGNLQ